MDMKQVLNPKGEQQTRPQVVSAHAPDESSQENQYLLLFVVAAFVGTIIALLTLPAWVPVLGSSIVGNEPKVYWYLSRATGLTAFALLWVSMVSGLLISNKMARVWPGAFNAFDLHQFTSLLGLGFIVLHIAVLLGNSYVPYNVVELLVPFASDAYRPLWIAVGQVALYIFIPVTFTFYIRKQIGARMWRAIHLLSYLVFAMSLLHSFFSGTDSGNVIVSGMYWVGAVSLAVLTVRRVQIAQPSPVTR